MGRDMGIAFAFFPFFFCTVILIDDLYYQPTIPDPILFDVLFSFPFVPLFHCTRLM